MALSRMRVKPAKRQIVPLSVDEVARFWSSFGTARDLAIVGLTKMAKQSASAISTHSALKACWISDRPD